MSLIAIPTSIPYLSSISFKKSDRRMNLRIDSGPSKNSGRPFEPVINADVSWDLSFSQYSDFEAWYVDTLSEGRMAFVLPFYDGAGKTNYNARFVGPIKYTYNDAGNGYIVSAPVQLTKISTVYSAATNGTTTVTGTYPNALLQFPAVNLYSMSLSTDSKTITQTNHSYAAIGSTLFQTALTGKIHFSIAIDSMPTDIAVAIGITSVAGAGLPINAGSYGYLSGNGRFGLPTSGFYDSGVHSAATPFGPGSVIDVDFDADTRVLTIAGHTVTVAPGTYYAIISYYNSPGSNTATNFSASVVQSAAPSGYGTVGSSQSTALSVTAPATLPYGARVGTPIVFNNATFNPTPTAIAYAIYVNGVNKGSSYTPLTTDDGYAVYVKATATDNVGATLASDSASSTAKKWHYTQTQAGTVTFNAGTYTFVQPTTEANSIILDPYTSDVGATYWASISTTYTNAGGSYNIGSVGFVKDANNFICAQLEHKTSIARFQVTLNGVTTFLGQVSKTWSSTSNKIAISLSGNTVKMYQWSGSAWTQLTSASLSSVINTASAGALTGFKPGIVVASNGGAFGWTISNLAYAAAATPATPA